jgi:hypothetical protein
VALRFSLPSPHCFTAPDWVSRDATLQSNGITPAVHDLNHDGPIHAAPGLGCLYES